MLLQNEVNLHTYEQYIDDICLFDVCKVSINFAYKILRNAYPLQIKVGKKSALNSRKYRFFVITVY